MRRIFRAAHLVTLCLLAALAHGQTWTQLGPVARYGHTAVFDPNTNEMIVFGGTDSAGPFNDVWASAGVKSTSYSLQWTQVLASGTESFGSEFQATFAQGETNNNMLAPPRAFSPAVFWAAQDRSFCGAG